MWLEGENLPPPCYLSEHLQQDSLRRAHALIYPTQSCQAATTQDVDVERDERCRGHRPGCSWAGTILRDLMLCTHFQ